MSSEATFSFAFSLLHNPKGVFNTTSDLKKKYARFESVWQLPSLASPRRRLIIAACVDDIHPISEVFLAIIHFLTLNFLLIVEEYAAVFSFQNLAPLSETSRGAMRVPNWPLRVDILSTSRGTGVVGPEAVD
jgi:hypothetical protein